MSITNEQYINRIAQISIGSSTLRNHPRNTISVAREYLRKFSLQELVGIKAVQFENVLDSHTLTLQKKIQKLDGNKKLYWGSARKALNLFLEHTCYHAILRDEYQLDQIEPYLEVPLDSQVAKELLLRAKAKKIHLPNWSTIKGLTPENSKAYQSFANKCALEEKCFRVQLDILFWRKDSAASGGWG